MRRPAATRAFFLVGLQCSNAEMLSTSPCQTGHFTKGAISLAVNGTVKQNSDLRNMIWSVDLQAVRSANSGFLRI